MSWPMVKLGSLVIDERSGASLSRDEFTDTGVAVVPKKAISESVDLLEETLVYTSREKFMASKSAHVSNRYLITTLRNLNPDGSTLGLICRNNVSGEFMLAQGMHAFLFDEDVDLNYICYASRQLQFRTAVQRVKVGSTQVHMRARELKDIEIPLPSLPEQKRIATILDKADAIRRKRQQAIQLADDFLRAVFLDMFGDPATNPKGWPVYKMSEVIDFKGGSQPPKETFEYEEREGYIRLVQIRDFRTDRFKTYIPENLARRRFEVDDVMIGRYGPPVFQILRGLSGSYNVALMKAVPKDGVTKDFVYRLLQLPTYQDAVISNSERTAGQTGVNLDLLNSLDVPLPPLEMQVSMSKSIRKTEALLSKLKLDLEDAEQLFSSLSQKAFSGKL